MKKLALLLVLAIAFPLAASKDRDKQKRKEKHFDPVAVTAAQAAGRYIGNDENYIIELTPTGGTLHRQSGTVALRNIVIEGSELRATVGGVPFHATFVNRVKNGETAFGLIVHHADIWLSEQMMISDLFCRRE
jgi:allophanate hydrolase subunit 2